MAEKETKPINLRTTAPKTIHINKPFLIIVLGVLAFIVAIAIIGIFKAPKIRGPKPTPTTEQELAPTVSPMVKKLPHDYKQTGKINKYLQMQDEARIPKKVQEQIAALKEQEAALQQQLSVLRGRGISPARPTNQMTQQAQRSALFFAGGLPPREMESPFTTPETQAAKSSEAKAAPSTDYEKQNMQQQKLKFLKESDKAEDIYNLHSMTTPISAYEVQAGTIIPAVLITAINTALPGNVVAQTRRDIYDTVSGEFLLIPKGSKLMGQYDSQVAYGQERVLIAFTRVIMPNGSSILLGKTGGSDLAGRSGMHGSVDSHWGSVLGAAVLSTLLSVGAGVAADALPGSGSDYYRGALQSAALGAASGISQTGQSMISRSMNVQPTLMIPAGYEFNIIVNKDMIMKPYSIEGL